MKRCSLYFILILFTTQLYSQQKNAIVEFLDSNIVANDTIEYAFSSWFTNYCGWGKSGCGDLKSIKDSIINDTIIIDLTFDYHGCSSRAFCGRADTSSITIADTGNYTMIMWWSRLDTIISTHQKIRFASDTAYFRVHPIISGLSSSVKTKQLNIPNPLQNNIRFDQLLSQGYQKLYLFDLAGKKVKESSIANELNVSDLKNGIYFLLLRGESVHYEQKIVIQR